MSLIDADALKRRAITVRFFGKDIMMIPTTEIDDAPTIDAVPVVMCKDCKHRRENCGMGDHRWCDFHRMTTRADDFCSYGRRKNDGSCK